MYVYSQVRYSTSSIRKFNLMPNAISAENAILCKKKKKIYTTIVHVDLVIQQPTVSKKYL